MAEPPDARLTRFLAALEDLQGFLLSPDVFRHSGDRVSRDVSLGNLMLAADSLAAAEDRPPPGLQAQAARALRRWETELSRRPAAVERKALAEWPHRFNVWTAYLDDLRVSPAEAARFPVEVRQRVILERLLRAVTTEKAASLRSQLDPADGALRLRWAATEFLWESRLKAAYPQPDYWFLYGRPRSD